MKLFIKAALVVVSTLSFAACSSSNNGASLKNAAAVNSAARIKGAKADAIISALKNIGVSVQSDEPGNADYRVSSLKCVTPDGNDMDNYFTSVCTTADVAAKVKGEKADALIKALKDAGIEARDTEGSLVYSLASLSCVTPDGSDMDNYFTSICDVSL